MASDPQPLPAQTQIQVRWPDTDDVVTLAANQFAVQVFQGGVIVTFGQAAPPLLAGTPEEQAAQLQGYGPVTVRPLGRYLLPPGTVREIAELLQRTIAVMDAESAAG